MLSTADGSACADAPGAATTNGLAFAAAPCSGAAEQRFFYTMNGNVYTVHAPGANSLCVDVNDSGAVVQYYCIPTASQQWTAYYNADGSSSLVNVASGKCLNRTGQSFTTTTCTAGVPTQEFVPQSVQGWTPPVAPAHRTAPVVPVPNGGAGIWQAGMYNGLPYRILFPQGYDPSRYQYPFVLFLHGEGEAGTDNISQLNLDFAQLGASPVFGQDYPVIIVAPQSASNNFGWGYPTDPGPSQAEALAVQLAEMLSTTLAADPARIGVTGLSMGGIGTYDMLVRFPGVFTFAAPVAGAELTSFTSDFLKLPMLVVHGGADAWIPVSYDEQLYAAVQAQGGKLMTYDEIPGAGHNVWDATYSSTSFWTWVQTGVLPSLPGQ